MVRIIFRWLASALVVLLAAYIMPGIDVSSFRVALLVALVLGFAHLFVKPILFLLTLPISVITLGFFTFVIDAILVMLGAAAVPGFEVDGFFWALLFSFVLSIANSFVKKGAKAI